MPFQGIFLLVNLAVWAVKIWALVDAAIRPDRSYRAADKQSKLFWVVILVVALLLGTGFLGIAALVASIVYLVDVRPRLREVQGRGGAASGPYGPW